MEHTEKELCFIITPIGEDTDPIRRHIDGIIDAAITPALSDKYNVQAAHHISKPGTITKQVIEAIYTAKLVVANLTGRNPNVMYELALRHAIGKPVIMIVERGTPVPSDIIMQRTIPYYNDAKGVLELRDDLKKAESEILFDNSKSGPIFDVLGDISHETRMLNKVGEENAESREPLEYIMRRLDKIESSISNQTYASTKRAFRETDISALCGDIPSDLDKDALVSELRTELDRAGCVLSGIVIDGEKIRLQVLHPDDFDTSLFPVYIYDVLDKQGVKLLSLRRR